MDECPVVYYMYLVSTNNRHILQVCLQISQIPQAAIQDGGVAVQLGEESLSVDVLESTFLPHSLCAVEVSSEAQ
jgi:hypothetical protein